MELEGIFNTENYTPLVFGEFCMILGMSVVILSRFKLKKLAN